MNQRIKKSKNQQEEKKTPANVPFPVTDEMTVMCERADDFKSSREPHLVEIAGDNRRIRKESYEK
jgi:hypothetical protein